MAARGLGARRPVVVHPQFTEPEAALRRAGLTVRRVLLQPPFLLDPALVPEDADLVVVGNPTNPTGVLHARESVPYTHLDVYKRQSWWWTPPTPPGRLLRSCTCLLYTSRCV